jgi:hypothetical protein
LKECTEVAKWRRYFLRLIEAIRVSIEASVEIYDQGWKDEIRENLDRGKSEAKASKSIEDLLSSFAATLLRQTFLQIGQLPNRPKADKVTLSRKNWRLCGHRSVQYVQSPDQVEAVFWDEQQSQIGFPAQIALYDRYRISMSKLPFSKWYREIGPEQGTSSTHRRSARGRAGATPTGREEALRERSERMPADDRGGHGRAQRGR